MNVFRTAGVVAAFVGVLFLTQPVVGGPIAPIRVDQLPGQINQVPEEIGQTPSTPKDFEVQMLRAQITSLQNQLDKKDAQITAQQTLIDLLQKQIDELKKGHNGN